MRVVLRWTIHYRRGPSTRGSYPIAGDEIVHVAARDGRVPSRSGHWPGSTKLRPTDHCVSTAQGLLSVGPHPERGLVCAHRSGGTLRSDGVKRHRSVWHLVRANHRPT